MSIRSTKVLATVATACFLVAASHQARAASIGINFNANSGTFTLGSSEIAGAPGVAQDEWNNLGSGALSNLNDDSGAATTLDITGTTQGGVFSGDNTSFTGAHEKLMDSELFRNGGGSITVSLDQVPYAQYDVYAYVAGCCADGRGGSVTTTNSSDTFFFKSDNTLGTYVQTTETGSFAAAPIGTNYAVFEDLTGSSFTATVTTISAQVYLLGLQIVDTTPATPAPEPSAIVLAALGLVGLVARWRRKR